MSIKSGYDSTSGLNPENIMFPMGLLVAMRPYNKRGKSWHTGIHGSRLRIGTAPDQHIVLSDDPYGSRFHAEVWLDLDPDDLGEPQFFLEDMNSTNGTYIIPNNEETKYQVTEKMRLYENDEILIGQHIFIFKVIPV